MSPSRNVVRSIALGVSLMTGSLAMALPMAAQAQQAGARPLVILRFNQPNVRYERPLASAVTRAMQAKPDVRFTLVSFVPVYGDEAVQAQLADRSAGLVAEVRRQMEAVGVASGNIEVAQQRSNALTHSEIHILAR